MEHSNKKHAILLIILTAIAVLTVVLVLVITNVGRGRNGTGTELLNIAVTFGDDPCTQKNFSWYTEDDSQNAVIQYYPASESDKAGAKFETSRAVTAEGFTERLDTYIPKAGEEYSASAALEPKSYTRHAVFVTGLEPGMRYMYRIGDGKNWSDTAEFTTAPDSSVSAGNGFSFLIVSDMQGYIYSDYELWGKVFGKAMDKCGSPAFMVNLGDFVERQDNALVWNYYFGLADGIENVTTVPVAGNKEDKMFLKYFLLGSRDGITGLNGYYSFDYMNVHFTVLNTGDGTKDLSKSQVKWLKNDLSSDKAKSAAFRVVLLHKAPYSDRNHADDSEIVKIRQQLLPLFDEYGADVVLEGHDHYYFRSEPVVSDGTVKAEYESSTVSAGGEKINVFTMQKNSSGSSGVFYFMPGASGVRQHTKEFRDMPEILTARSIILDDPTFCVCDVTEDHIYFRTYEVDRYKLTTAPVECWGIQK